MAGARTRIRPFLWALRGQFPGTTAVGTNRAHADAAVEWLYRSQDVTDTPGSSAGYNLVLGWHDVYPETTGYLVPTLYRYADLTGETAAADRATTMADWLCTLQHDGGSFPGGQGVDGPPTVFNTGQICFGLVEAYRRTGDSRYATAARGAADWLVAVQEADGAWRRHTFKNRKTTYTSRVAWALLEVASIVPYDPTTDDVDRYREAARANLEWVVERQRSNGWFDRAAFTSGGDPFLHTIAYTIRGLLEGGLALDDAALVEAARRSADVLLDLQAETGVLRGAFDPDWNGTWYYCLPGNAQMANVWLRLYETTGEERYRTAAAETVTFLKAHQALSGPAEIRGALAGSYPMFGRYIYFRYPNWGAKFLLDALLGLEALEMGDATAGDAAPRRRPAVRADGR